MKIRRYVFFLFFVFSLFYIYYNKKIFNLVYVEDTIVKHHLSHVIDLLNKETNPFNIDAKKVDFYAGNFNDTGIPPIKNKKHLNAIWIGSKSYLPLNNIKAFDFVFVSTVDLYYYLNSLGINTYLLPIFGIDDNISIDKKCNTNNPEKDCYWMVIGDMPDFISYLKSKNINFKQFDIADYDTLVNINKFSNIIGIASSNAFYHNNSLDISFLYFNAALYNIPIVVFNSPNNFNYLTLYLNCNTT